MSENSERPNRPVRGANKASEHSFGGEKSASDIPALAEEVVVGDEIVEPFAPALVEEIVVEDEMLPLGKSKTPTDDNEPLLETPLDASKKKSLISGIKSKTKNDKGAPKRKRSYNPKQRSLVITGGVLGGIALILGFSIYKVSQAPSVDDMVAVYQQQSGDFGFPVDKGVDSATRFLSLYLTAPESNDLRAQNKELLTDVSVNVSAPSVPPEVSQRIISGPTPAGILVQASPNSGSQRYTALIETTLTDAKQGFNATGEPFPAKVTTSLTQVTYRVNLEVDPTGVTVLVKGNPTLIPNTVITPEMRQFQQQVSIDAAFSTQLVNESLTPFFEVWGKSNEPAINNWLATGAEGQWTVGLGGRQAMESVKAVAPASVKANGEGDVTVDVQWLGTDGARQTSTYTLYMVQEGQKWLVRELS